LILIGWQVSVIHAISFIYLDTALAFGESRAIGG
jgi:hypothetical protein